MADDLNARLDRVEAKLDKVVDALTTLARVEERQSQQRQDHSRMWTVIEKLSARITDLENTTGRNTTILGIGERAWWVVFAAAVGAGFWVLRGVLVA